MANELSEQLNALASRLAARRRPILQAWREAVEHDPQATTGAELSRAQFYDHIPDLLDAFERSLRSQGGAEKASAEQESLSTAALHGLVRWQQGYKLQELMRDWGHLQMCLFKELHRDLLAHPEHDSSVLAPASLRLIELCNLGITQSAVEYGHLQQVEAEGRLAGLQQAVERLRELERGRAEIWREAAHDLRGNLGVVKNVTAGLNLEGLPEHKRAQLQALLKKGVDSLHGMLNDLVDLARLEAGHERRQIAGFDAAGLLRELTAGFKPLADERGLFLTASGPDVLQLEGDAVKVQRIAQNLLLNALHYTEQGGVIVSWARIETTDSARWLLCVQDTGPGFEDGALPPVAIAIKQATDESQDVENQGEQVGAPAHEIKPAPTMGSVSYTRRQRPGEGVGLSIVKRICEVLDATLELETEPGNGTTFRVSFPCHYK